MKRVPTLAEIRQAYTKGKPVAKKPVSKSVSKPAAKKPSYKPNPHKLFNSPIDSLFREPTDEEISHERMRIRNAKDKPNPDYVLMLRMDRITIPRKCTTSSWPSKTKTITASPQ